MNRPSLYGAFGDKHELYLAALDRYVAVSRGQMRRKSSPTSAPLAAGLQRVYDAALALYSRTRRAPLGCFLIGTAATEAAATAQVRGEAQLRARGA